MDARGIPQLDFHRKRGSDAEIEVLNLEDLLARKDSLPIAIEQPHRVHFHHVIFIARGQVHAFTMSPGISGIVVIFSGNYS